MGVRASPASPATSGQVHPWGPTSGVGTRAFPARAQAWTTSLSPDETTDVSGLALPTWPGGGSRESPPVTQAGPCLQAATSPWTGGAHVWQGQSRSLAQTASKGACELVVEGPGPWSHISSPRVHVNLPNGPLS